MSLTWPGSLEDRLSGNAYWFLSSPSLVPGGGGWDCFRGGGGGGGKGRFTACSLGGGPGGGGGKGGGGNDAGTAVVGFGGMGGGGGSGKNAGKTAPSAELASGSGGGGGGGGTAKTPSSDSVAEDDAAALDEAPNKGILGPAVQHENWLNKGDVKTISFTDILFYQSNMKKKFGIPIGEWYMGGFPGGGAPVGFNWGW